MQALFYPYITRSVEDEFDGFECLAYHAYKSWEANLQWKVAVLFQKKAPNGKNIYLVADREVFSASKEVRTYNILEFKHSFHRAKQEYQERVNG